MIKFNHLSCHLSYNSSCKTKSKREWTRKWTIKNVDETYHSVNCIDHDPTFGYLTLAIVCAPGKSFCISHTVSYFYYTVCCGIFKKGMLRPKDHHSMKEYPIGTKSPDIEILENRACTVNFQKPIFYKISSSKCFWRAVLKQYYEMHDFLGFQFMVILNLYGISFHAVMVFRSEHDFVFKSASTHCD